MFTSSMQIRLQDTASKTDSCEGTEAIIYTPHGIKAEDLQLVAEAEPPIRALALVHGLDDIALSVQQLNLGAHNGLKAQRILSSSYWIRTHDEPKKSSGMVASFLRRRILTVNDAVEKEKRDRDRKPGQVKSDAQDMKFLDLANGQSVLLA